MFDLAISAIYFIFPAYIANIFPVLAAKLKLPFGKAISPKLFGENKTYRGFYVGYLGAFIMLLLQEHLQSEGIFNNFRLIDYSSINVFLYSFLFGVGAISGDLLKSFFKRRLNKKPGSPWVPFDQLDFIVGALIFLSPFYQLVWQGVVVLLIVTPILHLLTNVTAYYLGLKKVWW